MATKKTGVLVGIAAIAVIGVAAVLYFSQWPPAEEDATGAIGAAERYRAEQITDEDVILDIPGQEQLAEAVFEVLTDEQKAELIGRVSEAERAGYYARFGDSNAFARMNARQQGSYVLALDRAAQERIASALRFEQADLARMELSLLAKGVADLDAKTRDLAFSRFEVNEATFQRMDTLQRAAFADVLGARALERAVLKTNSFNRLDAAQQRMVWANLGRSGQEAALRYAGFSADVARADALQRDAQFERYMQERFAQN
mgnify:CR=1 FL=1